MFYLKSFWYLCARDNSAREQTGFKLPANKSGWGIKTVTLREILKLPPDKKKKIKNGVWGEQGEGRHPTGFKIEFGHFLNEAI